MKVPPKMFHSNGHTTGYRRCQKSFTLGVKGLIACHVLWSESEMEGWWLDKSSKLTVMLFDPSYESSCHGQPMSSPNINYTNSLDWSPYISLYLTNSLEEFDKRAKHFSFGDHFINSHTFFSWKCIILIFLGENWCWSVLGLRDLSSKLPIRLAITLMDWPKNSLWSLKAFRDMFTLWTAKLKVSRRK